MGNGRQVGGDGVRDGGAAPSEQGGDELVGRDEQLERAGRLLDDLDGPRSLLVTGERGAGRTAFTGALAAARRAQGAAVVQLACAQGDRDHPLLLALRLFTAAQDLRPLPPARHTAERQAALAAVERGDGAALAETLTAVLVRSGATTVFVDDHPYADPASLSVLARVTAPESAADLRLVVTAPRPEGDGGAERDLPGADGAGRDLPEGDGAGRDLPVADRLAADGPAGVIELPRLDEEQVAELVVRRLGAVPDADLVRRAHRLTRGVPGAVDALLTGWEARGSVRVVDGHAFIAAGRPVPVLPDGDRYLAALHALGRSGRKMAGALSVLWPLGGAARDLAAESTGLSDAEAHEGLRALTASGLVDELPGGEGAFGGWRFRMPLVEHAVRERLGPLCRAHLSAAAVRALWAAQDAAADPLPFVGGTDRRTYLANRLADAGTLVDRGRAIAELTAAADQFLPDPEDRDVPGWLRAALRLVEEPAARESKREEYAKACFVAGDYPATLATVEALLRNPDRTLSEQQLEVVAVLLVVATMLGGDWPRIRRMGAAEWWDGRRLPVAVRETARAMALLQAEQWRAAADVLSRTGALWEREPGDRLVAELTWAIADLALGRPERFERSVAAVAQAAWPPGPALAMTLAHMDMLLGARDLPGAERLLTAYEVPQEAVPPAARFMLLHLRGRWDEALSLGRRVLANGQAFSRAPNTHTLFAWMAECLLARGYVTGAGRMLASAPRPPEGPLTVFLDAAQAQVLRTLDRDEEAEQVLRGSLAAADARGHVYATAELLAVLADLHADAGRTDRAARCVERLRGLAARTSGDRARLLHLLASARLLRAEQPAEARGRLREAVELARARRQPFETAVTLAAAAAGEAGPPGLLHEAYELFGSTGSLLARFHTRSALREAGLSVPGRRQATAESEQLLAVLVADGLSNREIATVLRISEDAVANRLSRLFARTGLRSRTELASAVLRMGPALIPA